MALSRRAGFPHLLHREYEFLTADERHRVTLLFDYAADEQSLILIAIGHVEYAEPLPGEDDDDTG